MVKAVEVILVILVLRLIFHLFLPRCVLIVLSYFRIDVLNFRGITFFLLFLGTPFRFLVLDLQLKLQGFVELVLLVEDYLYEGGFSAVEPVTEIGEDELHEVAIQF